MTLSRKQFCICTLVLAGMFLAIMLLLCGCGGETPQKSEGAQLQLDEYGVAYDEQGNWTTDGNVWFASSGNLWSTDGNYWYEQNWFFPYTDEAGQTLAMPYMVDWTTDGDYYATDGDAYWGDQTGNYATDGNAVPVSEVHVSNVDELLAALAPDTHIYLAPGEYNLNAVTPALWNYCYFRPLWDDGHELVLCNLSNCVIEGEGESAEDVVITQEHRVASVLVLEDCWQSQLRNLTLGHTPGSICSGAVLTTSGCFSIYVGDCDLYGCGTYGLQSDESSSVTIENSRIHDCTSGGVTINGGESFLFRHDVFDNAGTYSTVSLWNCGWAEFDGCEFCNTTEGQLLQAYSTWQTFFDNCSIHDNRYSILFDVTNNYPATQFNNCKWENNTVVEGDYFDYGQQVLMDGDPYEGRVVNWNSYGEDWDMCEGVPTPMPEAEPAPTPQPSGDEQALTTFMDSFFSAYMEANVPFLRQLVTEEYEGDIDFYEDVPGWQSGSAKGMMVEYNGVREAVSAVDPGPYPVSVAYEVYGEDSFNYLSMEVVRADNDYGWAVTFYGLEK